MHILYIYMALAICILLLMYNGIIDRLHDTMLLLCTTLFTYKNKKECTYNM